MEDTIRAAIAEFEKNRELLANVSNQKNQLEMQSKALESSLEALSTTKEKKAFKAVGPIMIQDDVEALKEELKNQKESADLRAKTLQKQEDTLVDKLNKLRNQIEEQSKSQGAPAASSADATTVTETKTEKTDSKKSAA